MLDRVLDRVDPRELVEEILAKNEIELSVKVSFKPKASPAPDQGPEAEREEG